MKFSDIVSYSLTSLGHRKMRSWLTVLGIVIGIASVVSLLMLGQGFSESVNSQLSALGGNTIFITPLAPGAANTAVLSGNIPPSAGKLTEKDVERIKRIPEVTDVARLLDGRASVKFKDKEIFATISGIEPGVFEKTTAIEIEQGRFLQENDRKVAVIGANIAQTTFGSDHKVDVNSYLTIEGEKYRVIGIMKKSGGGFGFASRQDSGIFIPFQDARQMFRNTFRTNEIGAMVLRTQEGSDTTAVAERINEELEISHKVTSDKRDFSVVDPKSIQASINAILSLVTLFLGAIASISLLVGALAIASSMFTSVLERTHEIGVLKAIGATEQDIHNIFLFESGALGGLGGVFGALLGSLVVLFATAFGAPPSFNLSIAVFGVVFAFIIGLFSGYSPAKKAASLAPVEALRYE